MLLSYIFWALATLSTLPVLGFLASFTSVLAPRLLVPLSNHSVSPALLQHSPILLKTLCLHGTTGNVVFFVALLTMPQWI